MNELQIFNNPVFGEMRIIKVNEQPYICLADVCKILDIKNARDCKTRLNQDGVVTTDTLTKGGKQQMTFINESNLYKVIFQSRKPEAEKFTEWVTNEVLPSIRKNGMYATDELLDNPDLAIKVFEQLKQEREEKKKLQLKNVQQKQLIGELKPKANYFDELVSRKLLTSFRDTAKELKIKEKDFIKYLIDNGYIYRDKKGKLQPYANKNNGLFEVKECYSNNNAWVGTQTLITPKGRETFRLLYV